METTFWESRHRLSRFIFYGELSFFVGLAIIFLGLVSLLSTIERNFFGLLTGGAFLTTVGVLMVFFSLMNIDRIYRSGEENSLAVINKNSNTVHFAPPDLKKVYLRTWPLKSRFGVIAYPTGFTFRTSLHPITTNPKVVPFDVSVTVGFQPDPTSQRFHEFISNPAPFRQGFNKNAFEALQHDLPQELANRLNPYDPQTINELTDFVARKLRGTLPFEHNVRCSLQERA